MNEPRICAAKFRIKLDEQRKPPRIDLALTITVDDLTTHEQIEAFFRQARQVIDQLAERIAADPQFPRRAT